MFYPEKSLKKGGKFHLIWVAGCWPARLASTTRRQLCSQDIRKTCDELLEVITNESSRPSQRFSLRLSSQLMLGLVRVYQKKVNGMISDLHMLNATIMKKSNKKFNIDYAAEEVERRMVPMLELPAPVGQPVPEPEETFEELICQSGNVVPNIEAITLKEVAIPDFQLPPNDGFGEEDPEQEWELLRDLTLEQMLSPSGPHSLMHSALDASASAPALAQDAELVPGLELHNTMDFMAECDITLFWKSTAQDLLREESDKEIPIPEIPPPDLPIPNENEKPLPEPEEPGPAPEEPAEVPEAAKAVPQEPEILTLETVEVGEPQAKRRRKNKLIIDKNYQLSKNFFCARIENINVTLRCEKKKPKGGYRTVRESQSQNFVPPEPEIEEKENIPDNWQTIPARTEEQPIIPNIEIQRASDPERFLTSMLQEAGLVDLQMTRPEQPPVEEVEVPPRKSRQCGSSSSESVPGSLDRNEVSLGDSDHTTDSKRIIRDQWGAEGIMVKIIKMVKAGTRPLNMDSLMSFEPMGPGSKRIIAARCFTLIMKLKQQGFIKLRKDPHTLEILDIFLGPKFDTC